jgi:hypothetical protein
MGMVRRVLKSLTELGGLLASGVLILFVVIAVRLATGFAFRDEAMRFLVVCTVVVVGGGWGGVASVIAIRAWRRRRLIDSRERRGLCVVCGYDLQGRSCICSECGTPRRGYVPKGTGVTNQVRQ